MSKSKKLFKNKMEIRYYTDDIKFFIKSLDEDSIAGILKLISLLRKCGNEIKMPYSKSLGGGLFELRKLGKKQVRIIYCFDNNVAVLLHVFEKKNNKINRNDLYLARQRKESLA